jgi:hypothetical protein
MATREIRTPPIIRDITSGSVHSAYATEMPLYEGLEALKPDYDELPSLEDIAFLQLQEGFTAEVGKHDWYVSEAGLYIGKGNSRAGKYISKKSPILPNIRQAAESQRGKYKDYHLLEMQAQWALEDALFISEIENQTKIQIPTEKDTWSNNEYFRKIITYLWGPLAQKYTAKLCEYNIKVIELLLAELKDVSFARQVRISKLNKREPLTIFCDDSELYCRGNVRAIKRNPSTFTKFLTWFRRK